MIFEDFYVRQGVALCWLCRVRLTSSIFISIMFDILIAELWKKKNRYRFIKKKKFNTDNLSLRQ